MAGFTDTAKDQMLTTLIGDYTYLSLHTADPGTTGANEVTGGSYARVQTTWGTPAGSSVTGSTAAITVPAGTTITYWGLWDDSTGGDFCTGGQLPAPETFSSAGAYDLTATVSAAG